MIAEKLLEDNNCKLTSNKLTIPIDYNNQASYLEKKGKLGMPAFTNELRNIFDSGFGYNHNGLPWKALEGDYSPLLSEILASKIVPSLFPVLHSKLVPPGTPGRSKRPFSFGVEAEHKILKGFYSVPVDKRGSAWKESMSLLVDGMIYEYKFKNRFYPENKLAPLDQRIIKAENVVHYKTGDKLMSCGQSSPPLAQYGRSGDLIKAYEGNLYQTELISKEEPLKYCPKCWNAYKRDSNSAFSNFTFDHQIASAVNPEKNLEEMVNFMKEKELIDDDYSIKSVTIEYKQLIYSKTAVLVLQHLQKTSRDDQEYLINYLTNDLSKLDGEIINQARGRTILPSDLSDLFNDLIDQRFKLSKGDFDQMVSERIKSLVASSESN
jgi:hypothetical protein